MNKYHPDGRQDHPSDPSIETIAFHLGRSFEGLTAREREVLAHRLLGRSYQETATQMQITPYAVGKYLSYAYQRLDIHGYADLIGLVVLDVDGVEEIARRFITRAAADEWERQTLLLILSGEPSTMIAERLGTTRGTVLTMLRRLYRRLEVRNLADLVRRIITVWIDTVSTVQVTIALHLRIADPPPPWMQEHLHPFAANHRYRLFAFGTVSVYDAVSDLWFTHQG